MPTTVRELFDSQSGDVSGLIAHCRRVFQVEGNGDPAKALSAPGIPPDNDSFEYNGVRVLLRSHQIERESPTVVRVIALYDNDGSGRSGITPDPLDPFYKEINIQWVRDVERIPAWYLYHDVVSLGPDGNGPFARLERWAPIEIDWSTRHAVAEVTVNLTTMDGTIQRKIAEQVDVIHTFPNGLRWQFVGGSTRRTGETQWQVVYQWVHEPGRRNPPDKAILQPLVTAGAFDFVERLTPPGALNTGATLYPTIARPPFGRYQHIAPQEPYSDTRPIDRFRPDIGVCPPEVIRDVQPNGYLTLPGMPI